MRKIMTAALLSALMAFLPAVAYAEKESPVDIGEVKAVCLIEAGSGAILIEHEGNTAAEAAGLLRLPALLLACEQADKGGISPEQSVSVSSEAAAVKGPTAFLSSGEKISIAGLLKSAIMITAGDAIYALSEAVTPSDDVFISSLNQRLADIGSNAVYSDRMGQGVQLSAYELAKIGAELVKSESFLTYSGLYYETLEHDSGLLTEMASANKLIKTCKGTNGVATGSSAQSGYCGVFSAERDGNSFVCAVLGAKNAAERAKVAKALLEYAFAAYETKNLAKKGEVLYKDIPVIGGTQTDCELIAANELCVVLPKGEGAYTEKAEVPESVSAPVRAGEIMGKITYLDADGGILARVDLTVSSDIEKAAWRDYLSRMIGSFLHQ